MIRRWVAEGEKGRGEGVLIDGGDRHRHDEYTHE